MRYLIDTQIAIWAKENNPKLKFHVREILENPDNEILVSQFSLIELAIKYKIGNLPNFIIDIETFVETLIEDGFSILPISSFSIFSYQNIPLFSDHKDPFDRLIIATGYAENIAIVSADENFKRYVPQITLIEA